MRPLLNLKSFQRVNFIYSIIILSLLGTSCTIRQFVIEKKLFDAIYEGQNLIPNGGIEILDNGQPVRWNYQGKCAVGSPGFQSDYALTKEVPGQDISTKWETQLNSIKPHTKYVTSFWYRLPEKGRIAFK
jgi:hypothetical protein